MSDMWPSRVALLSVMAVVLAAVVSGCAAGPGSSSASPAVPQLDAHVAGELDTALAAVKQNPGVETATKRILITQTFKDKNGRDVTPEGLDAWNDAQLNPGSTEPTSPSGIRQGVPTERPTPPPGSTESHVFSASFTVEMKPDASASQTGMVPTTMAKKIAWTAVNLSLDTPAADGRIATTTSYSGTFDQTIPIETSTAVADGMTAIAEFPGLTGVEAGIPYTLRVDYGNLNLEGRLSEDQQARLRAVIAGTIFKDTTLHGAIPNGAKP
ncbi:hypothetical protein AX769_02110 [Frondihabitans sp. PAMC 28766]|uniref:hypothetical protein n=1 Tax=Frondihabitans sp. PAMC 28766 TaxID=1795630 RepID=UPI00078D8EDD|nr:hypothetical protein [Frondihabitans sp. PAMC 28766]AMM19147.1 hypothetical protein AX769_02110 [Frondihabitans sp. PAMC 28766]